MLKQVFALVCYLCSFNSVLSKTTGCDNQYSSSHWLHSQGVGTSTGLLVSFDAPSAQSWTVNRGYSYDQAVAVIGWLLADNANNTHAYNLVQSMSSLFVWSVESDDNGGNASRAAVPFYWNTETGAGSSLYRTGNHAWVTYAFAMFELVTGSSEFSDELNALCYWLLDRISTANSCLVGGPDVSWCSTEHNIDSFFALHLTSWLRSRDGSIELSNKFGAGARVAAKGLFTNLWNEAGSRFNQGVSDTFTALDAQTWGSLFLQGIDAELVSNITGGSVDTTDRAATSLAYATSTCTSTQRSILTDEISTGFSPYIDPDGNGGDNGGGCVWSEGTYGAAMAFYRFNKTSTSEYDSILLGVDPLVNNETGSVLYSANKTKVSSWGDIFYPFPNVACTGWRMLACSSGALTGFWNATTSNYVKLSQSSPLMPTSTPTSFPTLQPFLSPTLLPIPTPTSVPIPSPMSSPTSVPISSPTQVPIPAPTSVPISSPTQVPIPTPTSVPISSPTQVPIPAPTSVPIPLPTITPTSVPTMQPTSTDTFTVAVSFDLTSISIPSVSDEANLKSTIAKGLNVSAVSIKSFDLTYVSASSRRHLLSSYVWTAYFDLTLSLASTESSSSSEYVSYVTTTITSASFTSSVVSSVSATVDTSSVVSTLTTRSPTFQPSMMQQDDKDDNKDDEIVGVDQATFGIIVGCVAIVFIGIFAGVWLIRSKQPSSLDEKLQEERDIGVSLSSPTLKPENVPTASIAVETNTGKGIGSKF